MKETQTEKGCREILDELIQRDFVRACTAADVKAVIVKLRGADPRTQKVWLSAMVTLGYLAQKNAAVYQVNLSKCSDVLQEKIRSHQNPGQKRLMP